MNDQPILRPLFDWRSCVASPFGPPNPTTRHVLLTLSLHMSVKGDSCFPSIDRLTEESGLSRRAVVEHLRIAHVSGWIGKQDRSERSGQGWRRVEYFPRIPDGVEQLVKGLNEERGASRALPKGGARDAPPFEAGASGDKGGAPDRNNVVHEVPLSTAVNSSTSTSSNAPLKSRERPVKGKGQRTIPSDFAITPDVRRWAEAKGYGPYLDAHLEYFLNYASNGRKAVDWEATFRNCVLSDWGNIRRQMVHEGIKPVRKGAAASAALKCAWEHEGERCIEDGQVALGDGRFSCASHYRGFTAMLKRAKQSTEVVA